MGRYSPSNIPWATRGIDLGDAAQAFMATREAARRRDLMEEQAERSRTGFDYDMANEGYERMDPAVAKAVQRDGMPTFGRTGNTGPFPEAAPPKMIGGYVKTGPSAAERQQRAQGVARQQAREAAARADDAAVGATIQTGRGLGFSDPELPALAMSPDKAVDVFARIMEDRRKVPTPRNIDPLSAEGIDARLRYDRERRRLGIGQPTTEKALKPRSLNEVQDLAGTYLDQQLDQGVPLTGGNPADPLEQRTYRQLVAEGNGPRNGENPLLFLSAIKQAAQQRRARQGTNYFAQPPVTGVASDAPARPAPSRLAPAPEPVAEPSAGPTELTDPGQVANVVRSIRDFTPAAQAAAMARFGPKTRAAIKAQLAGR